MASDGASGSFVNMGAAGGGGGAAQAAAMESGTAGSGSGAVGAAGQQVAQQALHEAGRVVRRGANEVKFYVQANPTSVTVLSFFGGCVLMVGSILSIINVLNVTQPLWYILQIYQVLFGLIIVVFDGPRDKLPEALRTQVMTAASFLHNRVSRCLFYLFIASEQASQPGMIGQVVGWYFALVAVLFIFVQLRTTPDNPEMTQQLAH